MAEIVALVDEPPPSQPSASLKFAIHDSRQVRSHSDLFLGFSCFTDDALKLLLLLMEKEFFVPSVSADFGEWLSAKRRQFNTLLLRIDSIH